MESSNSFKVLDLGARDVANVTKFLERVCGKRSHPSTLQTAFKSRSKVWIGAYCCGCLIGLLMAIKKDDPEGRKIVLLEVDLAGCDYSEEDEEEVYSQLLGALKRKTAKNEHIEIEIQSENTLMCYLLDKNCFIALQETSYKGNARILYRFGRKTKSPLWKDHLKKFRSTQTIYKDLSRKGINPG